MKRDQSRIFLALVLIASPVGAQESGRTTDNSRSVIGAPSECTEQAPVPFLAWARETAIPISTTEPGKGFKDLQPLKKVIGNARVVALGESLHGVHEFYQVRHRLLEFLVEEMGFTAFAMETGFAEAVKINDYLLGRLDEPERWQHNWFTWGFGNEQELLALVRWMRRYNENPRHTRKLHFYGIDVAFTYSSPLAAIEGALTYLDKVDPEYAAFQRQQGVVSLVGKFLGSGGGDEVRRVSLNKYKKLAVEERNAYTAAIADLLARFETMRVDYIHRSSEDEYEWARHYAIAARQLDTAYRAAAAATKAEQELSPSSDPVAAYTARDRAMADNVLWALQREGPGGRIVLWAHNSHIMKERTAEAGLQKLAYKNWLQGPSLGLFLDSLLGRDYVNIGFTYYQGAKSGWASYQTGVSEPAKCGTLDGELDRVGLPMFVLDLRSAPKRGPVYEWLNQVRIMRESAPEYDYRLNPTQAFDAVFHIRHISPAQSE